MSRVKFSLAVLGTSLVLVGALGVAGMFAVGHAFANAAPFMQQAQWSGQNLPPELSGLKDIPAADRFAHFKGIQANLTDKDGKPLSVTVTPGVATNVSSTSLTLNGNDGASHTYTLDAQTITHGQTVAQGQDVVVVTLNNGSNATAVVGVDPSATHQGGPPWAQHQR
ncbi:MAG: hypothetical protein JOZ81_31420 [Chloroflexi bacterium]|nr:hypothetical protein [Chloroflexota bacterium]